MSILLTSTFLLYLAPGSKCLYAPGGLLLRTLLTDLTRFRCISCSWELWEQSYLFGL